MRDDPCLSAANLAVAFRRLHDLNRSGWWYGAIMILGLFLAILLVPCVIRMHENQLAGYSPTDGIPFAVFLVMAVLGTVEGLLSLLLLIWFFLPGTRGQNRFGADPLRSSRATVGF